jgi:hypothetical protein
MTKRIVALSCCLALVQGSVVAAQDSPASRPASLTLAAVDAVPQPGPIHRASLGKNSDTLLNVEARWASRPVQDESGSNESWVERHPVWTGAILGFAAGFVLTYAATHDNNENELFKVMDPAGGAFIWGSVCAGIGALAGWGIGRNRDEGSR